MIVRGSIGIGGPDANMVSVPHHFILESVNSVPSSLFRYGKIFNIHQIPGVMIVNLKKKRALNPKPCRPCESTQEKLVVEQSLTQWKNPEVSTVRLCTILPIFSMISIPQDDEGVWLSRPQGLWCCYAFQAPVNLNPRSLP